MEKLNRLPGRLDKPFWNNDAWDNRAHKKKKPPQSADGQAKKRTGANPPSNSGCWEENLRQSKTTKITVYQEARARN